MTPDEARELFEHYEFDDERNDAEDERRRNAMRERVRVALKPLNYDRRHVWMSTYPATMRLLVGAGLNVNWGHFLMKKTSRKPLQGQLSLL